jgi:hypothetical protein
MRTIDDVLNQLRAEFIEMPGMRLQVRQVQRLCGIEQTMCQQVLDSLVDEKFLYAKSDGHYARLTDGYHPGPVKAAPGKDHRKQVATLPAAKLRG